MYSVVLDARIFDEDFRTIDRPQQQRLIRTIRKKAHSRPIQIRAATERQLERILEAQGG